MFAVVRKLLISDRSVRAGRWIERGLFLNPGLDGRTLGLLGLGMVGQGAHAVMPFGVMGGHFQACGHAHFLTNVIDYGMDPQAALDCPPPFHFGRVMALGTMSALEANDRIDDVLVTGMGGQPDELEMVARGKLGVAVFRDPRSMGKNSADALLMHLAGREEEIPRVLYTALRTLDSTDTIRQYVPKAMLDIDAKLAE